MNDALKRHYDPLNEGNIGPGEYAMRCYHIGRGTRRVRYDMMYAMGLPLTLEQRKRLLLFTWIRENLDRVRGKALKEIMVLYNKELNSLA